MCSKTTPLASTYSRIDEQEEGKLGTIQTQIWSIVVSIGPDSDHFDLYPDPKKINKSFVSNPKNRIGLGFHIRI